MSDPISAEQVSELAALLRARRQQLEARLGAVEPSTRPVELDQQAVGRVSRIDAIAQQQMDSARMHNVEEGLRAVIVAQSRVESGDYGYCIDCDQPIAYQRLAITPETILCLDCASKREGQ